MSWESAHRISRSWAEMLTFYVLLFGFVYLAWYFAMDRTKEQSDFVQIARKLPRIPWQWLDKRLEKKAWAYTKSADSAILEKGETVEEQSQEHAHYFTNNPSWQAHEVNSAYCCNFLLHETGWKCAKTSSRTLATKELLTVVHFLFNQGMFGQLEAPNICMCIVLHWQPDSPSRYAFLTNIMDNTQNNWVLNSVHHPIF
jgi:hypothetical protein